MHTDNFRPRANASNSVSYCEPDAFALTAADASALTAADAFALTAVDTFVLTDHRQSRMRRDEG